jgi:hypothetical protein
LMVTMLLNAASESRASCRSDRACWTSM